MNIEVSLANIALALSDPLRLRILDLLCAGRNERCHSPGNPDLPQALCALDLQRQIGDIAPSKLAYHLKELREVGLIHERKNGKYVYYQLNQACIKQFLQDTNQRYLAAQGSGVRSRKSEACASVNPFQETQRHKELKPQRSGV